MSVLAEEPLVRVGGPTDDVGPLLGSNVSTVGGIANAFAQAEAWNCASVQIYATPSRRWQVPELDTAVEAAWHERLAASGVRAAVAHVPFLVNLASPDPDARERSTARLVTEIRRAARLGLAAVILHPGAGGPSPRRRALLDAAAGLSAAVEQTADCPVGVLVENMAGQGSVLCARFEELAELLAQADAGPRLGVCLDTAHAFIAGLPLTGYAGYEKVIEHLDGTVGLGRVGAVHLNDALTAPGSRHDRHAAPGEGQMGAAVFHAFMRDGRFAGRPAILEVPDRDGGSLRALDLLRFLAVRPEPLTEADRLAGDAHVQLELHGGLVEAGGGWQ